MFTHLAVSVDEPGTSVTMTRSPAVTALWATPVPGEKKSVDDVVVMACGVAHPGMSSVKPVDDGAGDAATVPLTLGPCQNPHTPPEGCDPGSEVLFSGFV